MRRILLLLVAVVATMSLYAQPKQTIVSVAVAPENTDWQYECGDDVTFSLAVNKAGIPLKDATIYYVGPTPAKPGQVIGSEDG